MLVHIRTNSMDRLSDYVLVQLIHRCSLVERLNSLLKQRSRLRSYLAYTNPLPVYENATMAFLDRYDHITHLEVNSVDWFSLYLSDKVMSSLISLTVRCRTAYDLATCDDVPERCTSLENLIVGASDTVTVDVIDACNEFYSRFSNKVNFRMNSPTAVLFPRLYHEDTEGSLVECHKARQVSMESSATVSGECVRKIVTRTSDDSTDVYVTLGHCPRLASLSIRHTACIDTFPNTLTELSLRRASPEQLKKIRSPLERLHIQELVEDTSAGLTVCEFIPPSVTILAIEKASSAFLDFSGTRLRSLNVASRFVMKEILPSSLTELTARAISSDAVSHLRHLKSLTYTVSLDDMPIIWPDSLIELILIEPVVSVHDEGFDIGDTSRLRLPARLPRCLRVLYSVRPSNSLSIFACPDTWTLGQLTTLRLDSVALTREQITSLRCNSVMTDNSEEELSILTEKAQRRIKITVQDPIGC